MRVPDLDPRSAGSMPQGLAREIAASGIAIHSSTTAPKTWRHPRVYMRGAGPGGPVFLRYVTHPSEHAVLEHERRAREIASRAGIDVPAVLAHGAGWMIERVIAARPLVSEDVSRLTSMAAKLIKVAVPPGPSLRVSPTNRAISWWQRAHLVRRPGLARDFAKARRILSSSRLPLAPAHGDLHLGNVLIDDAGAFLIDWEQSGPRPAGFDLMRLWISLDEREARSQVFEAAVALVGEEHRVDLEELRYAQLVRIIAHKFAADPAHTKTLVALLPEARRT